MRKYKWMAVCAMTPALHGWGPEGHSLVARLAEMQLTPAARTRVVAILGPGKTLASIASWADEVRRARPETGSWHYVDIPIDERHLNMDRDCPKGDCVLARIVLFRQILGDPAAIDTEREEALKFLVHFIADMHQPLHCANNDDKGGNSVRLMFQDRPTNLHSLWDSGMLARLGTEDQLFPELSKAAERRAGKWSKGGVEDWAEEAHKAAQKLVYGRLPKSATLDQPLVIAKAYQEPAHALIREQLIKAGDRLARVLNETLE
jgi:hypothetical protein